MYHAGASVSAWLESQAMPAKAVKSLPVTGAGRSIWEISDETTSEATGIMSYAHERTW